MFRLTPGDYRYGKLTKRIGGLLTICGESCQIVVDGRSLRLDPIEGNDPRRLSIPCWGGRWADMEQFLQVPSPSKPSMMELRKACSDALLRELKRHMTDLPQPFHDLGPTMKLVLDMWLPGLALERLEMLG